MIGLKVKVNFQKNNSNKCIPLFKSCIHEDVMAIRHEEDRVVLLMKNGNRMMYSKTHYNIKELM